MKNAFKEYYRPNELEFSELWNQCIFVPDANVLLSLYRYSANTVRELIDIFNKLSELKRIWIPHRVGFEYHRNRLNVINEQIEAYDALIKDITSAKDQLKGKMGRYKKHPLIDMERINRKIERLCSSITGELAKRKTEHPDLLNDDTIRSSITNIFDGQIGRNFSSEELSDIYKEGVKRYEKKTPPGYKDEEKQEEEKFGDLIIWLQIIDKAKESGKPIILITDDIKDDWWLVFKGQTIGPRPELIKEISEKAKVSFYMYQSDRFLEYSREYLKQDIKQRTINEIRDFKKIDKEKEELRKQLRERTIELSIDEKNQEIQNIEEKLGLLRINIDYLNRIVHDQRFSEHINNDEMSKLLSDRMQSLKQHAILKNELKELYNNKTYLEQKKNEDY